MDMVYDAVKTTRPWSDWMVDLFLGGVPGLSDWCFVWCLASRGRGRPGDSGPCQVVSGGQLGRHRVLIQQLQLSYYSAT
jgi:hypothetical protein